MGIISGGGFRFLRLFVRAFVVVGLACLVVVGCASGSHGVTRRTRTESSNFKNRAVLDKVELVRHSDLNLTYMMSARKVPNGPDPIHNRRTRTSGRPPVQD